MFLDRFSTLKIKIEMPMIRYFDSPSEGKFPVKKTFSLRSCLIQDTNQQKAPRSEYGPTEIS